MKDIWIVIGIFLFSIVFALIIRWLLNKNEKEELSKETEKEAKRISEYEANVNPDFDIDEAIKRENEIKEKVARGEMTEEQAKQEFVKPLGKERSQFVQNIDKIKGIVPYEEVYEKATGRKLETQKTQAQLYSESLKLDRSKLNKNRQNNIEDKTFNKNMDYHETEMDL